MKTRYRLAIFDLDGTLLDTILDLAAATNAALAANGYPARSVDEVRSFVGDGTKKLIARAVPSGTGESNIARVHADFIAYYTAHSADRTAPYAGILDMLRALRARGVKTAVLSNKVDHATRALCDRYFSGLLDVVAGEREGEGIPKKPAPDGVFEIMRTANVTAEEAVYVGDSEVDIKTARNAGIDEILVSWGFRDAALLRQNGARNIVDTAKELEVLIVGESKMHTLGSS